MLIREAHVQDVDQMIAIEELCYEHPWPRESFEEEVVDSDIGFGFIAEEESMVVGFAVGMKVVDEFHLHNLAVHPDFTGIGVGRKLVEAVDRFCRQSEFRRILLEVKKDNKTARQLYTSMGFKAVGTRKDYYGPGQDAYLYTKKMELDE